jgi:fatty-acyl-CoA synthase
MSQLSTAYWQADTSVPVLPTTIGGILRATAESDGDRVALIGGDPDPQRRPRWSYRELLAEAERAARALLTRFQPGERVAVWAANRPEWVLLEFATALAGLTLVPVNPAYQADELGYVLSNSRARGVFLADRYRSNDLPAILAAVRVRLPDLREVIPLTGWDAFTASGDDGAPLPEVDPADPAQVLYTSGTTGRPKGALLTHRGLTNNARLVCEAMGVRDGDVLVNPMPLFHVAGAGLLTLGPVQRAATHVLVPHFDPALVLELFETYRSALFGGVPTMLHALLAHPAFTKRDLSSVRYGVSGGATVPPSVVRQVADALGIPLLITFAQTEASCSITVTRPGDSADDRAETLGRPLPQTEVKTTDPRSGETAGCGVIGEICTRGYHVMLGYLGNGEATNAAIDADGWLHTGDLGSMDERGYCRIEGRVKDMIIRGGENIYPREIEMTLLSHPGVAEVSVVGVADPYWGEIVGAVIRSPDPVPPAPGELAEFCGSRLAAYKVPVRWLFVDAFPLTGTGKVRKDVLSARLAEE